MPLDQNLVIEQSYTSSPGRAEAVWAAVEASVAVNSIGFYSLNSGSI